jgi:hypothetical protein
MAPCRGNIDNANNIVKLFVDGLQIPGGTLSTTSNPDNTGTQPLRIGQNSQPLLGPDDNIDFRPVITRISKIKPLWVVVADEAFDSEDNNVMVRETEGIWCYITKT